MRLLRRDVVWIESAIEDSQGDSDWYAVRTRRNVHGWIPRGPADDPYATSISSQDPFTSCGQVQVVGHYGLINGLRAAHVDRFARATFALAIATDTPGCIRFSNAGDRSNRSLSLDVHACGAPSWDGSVMTLLPTSAGNVDESWRVDAPTVVADELITFLQTPDGDGLTNRQKILILASRTPSPFGCVQSDLDMTNGGGDPKVFAELTDCLVLLQQGGGTVTVAPAAGGDSVVLRKESRGQLADVPLHDPRILRFVSGSRTLGSQLLGTC